MGEGGWDLQAVVRGCSGLAAQEDLLSSFVPEVLEPSSFSLCDLPSPPSDLHELEDLCKPFISRALHRDQREPKRDLVSPKRSSPSLSTPSSLSNRAKPLAAARKALLHTPTTKRRKNQQKKVVCHVPADKISSDLWAWRKYGQKPIKGSPFPRGYYKCSSSKGCMARKQVERSPVDPGVFIITYTAEHNHPIPIPRQKAAGGQEVSAAADCGADLPGPPSNATSSYSPSVQKEDDVEEDLPRVGAEEIMSEEEMRFLGTEEEPKGGGATAFAAILSDHFGGGFPPPWLTSSATAV